MTAGWRELEMESTKACLLDAQGALSCWGNLASPFADGLWTGAGLHGLSISSDGGCALDALDALVCWGSSDIVDGAPVGGTWSAVEVGQGHACALSSVGALECWGEARQDNFLGIERLRGSYEQVAIESSASGSDYAVCVIDDADALHCVSSSGELQPLEDEVPPGSFRGVEIGESTACAVSLQDDLACWGSAESGLVAGAPSDGSWLSVHCAPQVHCALSTQGAVSCWGAPGNAVVLAAPSSVAGGFATLDVGAEQACALDGEGRMTCWGAADSAADEAPTGPGYKEVAVGPSRYACAIDADDQIECWGTPTQQSAPGTGGWNTIPVPEGAPWSGLVVNDSRACASGPFGIFVCWGQLNEAWNHDELRGQPSNDLGPRALNDRYGCGLEAGGGLTCWGTSASLRDF